MNPHIKPTSTDKAPEAIGPYSQALSVANLVFTSGAIALRPDGSFVEGDIKAQSAQVMQNLKAILEASDSDMQSVIKTTCFLANMDDFAAFNKVYASAFEGHKPARSTIAVKTLPKNALVEVEAIAVKKPR